MAAKSFGCHSPLAVLAALLASVSTAACGSATNLPRSNGRGFGLGSGDDPGGLSPPSPTATAAELASRAVASRDWDIAVALSPTDAQVEEAGHKWTVSTSDVRGALTVLAIRDPGVQSAEQLAGLLRRERQSKGEDVGVLEGDTLVGYPAARWVSVSDGSVATLVLLAHHEPCVYMLIASSKGTTEEIVDYFRWAVGLVRTVSGGAASGPACR